MVPFRAYAKINLGLFVIEKRTDGYHDIETVFHRVNLFDEIAFGNDDEISIESSSAEVAGDNTNICFKAARLLQDHLGISQGVKISIHKNIPVGAGLGGGSSDAAIVLRHLPRFWKSSCSEEDLRSLALRLGSDVPYFLTHDSALARGRGEQLEPFTLNVPYHILLCYPNIHVATAWAYQRVKPSGKRVGPSVKDVVTAGMTNPDNLSLIRNDFEGPVFAVHAEVEQTKKEMIACGALFALMSGSGSSVYGLFSSLDAARSAASGFTARGYIVSITPPGFQATQHPH